MDQRLADLLVAIVSYVTTHDGYVTKTKLLKLLYLLDVEFYRAHGQTFTGFKWKYFHLGPWTGEFDPLFKDLISQGALVEDVRERPEYDTRFLRASNAVDLRKPFDSYKDEALLKILLDTWGPSTTGEILDYVYFRTEPMEHGIRNENLDFARILPQAPETYKRVPSKETQGEIRKLRKAFGERVAQLAGKPFPFTEPRYDDEFRAAMEKLDNGIL